MVAEPEPAELLAAISRALDGMPNLAAALLFGSRARGSARAESDIDVAVLLDTVPHPSQRSATMRRVIEAIGRELAADRLDVVLLNDAPPKLAFHVLSKGQVALVRDPVALHRFRVRTYARHADYAPIERFFREVTRKRAQREAPIG